MSGVTSNADALAARYRRRAQQLDGALARALRRVVAAVETEAERNLGGAGAPGSYPVPVVTGNLRRSMGVRITGLTGFVFNTAQYAAATQAGFQPYGNPAATAIPPRPFLRDADRKVDPAERFRREVFAVISQGADA